MIKTHKPRGYFWTHSSAFQRTREFRNICYDECIAQTSTCLLLGPGETVSKAQHARKRQRIEKLADDFLNGEPLTISSARPCPTSLKSSIVWNQRSSGIPSFEIPDLEPANDINHVEHDMMNDDNTTREGPRPRDNTLKMTRELDSRSEEQDQVTAKASHPRLRRGKSVNITAGPSEDALRKAADLRARRAQSKETEAVAIAQQDIGSGRRLRSSAKRRELQRHLKQRYTSMACRLDDGEGDGEEGLDELRLSRIETPSNPPKAPQSSAISQSVARLAISEPSGGNQGLQADHETISITPRTNTSSHPFASDCHEDELGFSPSGANDECLEHHSYQTAPEQNENQKEHESKSGSQGHAQSRLENNFGFMEAPSRSRESVNQQQTNLAKMNEDAQKDVSGNPADCSNVDPGSSGDGTSRGLAASSGVVSSTVGDSIQVHAVQRVGKPIMYATGKPSENASSPFRWRRKVTFPSSNESIVAPKQQQSRYHRNEAVSQSAPVTPAATMLRRPSNMQLFPSEVDAARSSPLRTSHTPAEETKDVSATRQSLPETWIGTQAMLQRAQKDLIISPEKPGSPAETLDSQGPIGSNIEADLVSQQSDRDPLKQLSQEPAPSTQALLGDFVGFSTVKKPWRNGPRESIDSPSVLLRTKKPEREPTNQEPSIVSHGLSQKQKGRHSNSNRMSLESIDSLLHTSNIDKLPFANTPKLQRDADWSSTNIAASSSILKRLCTGSAPDKSTSLKSENSCSDEGATSEAESHIPSFSTAVPLPSFQAAQRQSLSPQEDPDVDRTVDELATELLNTEDMDAVLSQVR